MVSALDRLSYTAGRLPGSPGMLATMPPAAADEAHAQARFCHWADAGRAELTADMRRCSSGNGGDVAAGLFPAPRLLGPEPAEFLRRSLLYFATCRRSMRGGTVPWTTKCRRHPGRRPARLLPAEFPLPERRLALGPLRRPYDTQVEVLFTGAADVMRRRALAPIATWLAGATSARSGGSTSPAARPPARRRAWRWPGMKLTGIDLSPPLPRRGPPPDRAHRPGEAREVRPNPFLRRGQSRPGRLLVPAARTAKEIRAKAIVEMARVVKPGGLVVIVDSLQKADRPVERPARPLPALLP